MNATGQTPDEQYIFYKPYEDETSNYIYNLLFCDNPELYKFTVEPPYEYPFDVLFAAAPAAEALQELIDDPNADPRIKILSYNKQLAEGYTPAQKELLAVIVEVGLEDGLDTLASFNDGTARYINKTGKILVWETTADKKANGITSALFATSRQIVEKIGPWMHPRKQHPATGNTRITFLASDGLYFGEGATSALFSDGLAGPALASAVQLLQYVTEHGTEVGGGEE